MTSPRLTAWSLVLAAAGVVVPIEAPADVGPDAGMGSPVHASVNVLVPDADNLQYLAFWTAKGAGFFEAEGVSIDLRVPQIPAQAIAWMIAGEAPVAVLPPPVYLQLVADRFPVRLVANLLQNDPIDLIVRRSVFADRRMDAHASLRNRLQSLHGLRVGVAPGPPARLRALFSSVGLDADHDVQLVIRKGPEQNDAFGRDECDALYAHTPYLEKAIDDQDAVMLVNQSAGEVPSLSMRQIHALVVRDDYLASAQPVVVAMVRAIARAEILIREDLPATEDAVMRAIPSMDRRHLHTLLRLYQPAVPEVPNVSVEGLAPALALFPASRVAPSLDGVPLADFVAPDLVARQWLTTSGQSAAPNATPARRFGWPRFLVAALAVLGLLATAAWRLGRRGST